MFCRHCGADIPEDSKFCKSCGKDTGAPVEKKEEIKPVEAQKPVTKRQIKKQKTLLIVAVISLLIAAAGFSLAFMYLR